MYDVLEQAAAVVERFVSTLEPKQIGGDDAVSLVQIFARLERVASAGRTVAGRRVEETRAWYGRGHRNAAQWMAEQAQSTLASAIAIMDTGRRLDSLPVTREAFVSGDLSMQQAQHITEAAATDPAAEESLLDAARKESVGSLREQCQQVIAAASADLDEDQRRHRSRSLRLWPKDGMIHMEGQFTTDAGAKLMAVVQARSQEFLSQARAAGSRERREAYAADALTSLVEGAVPGPKAVVNVLVDYEAIQRGRLEKGDRCAIPGIGPVSLQATKRLAEEGLIHLIVTEGADVRDVISLGRTVTAKQRAALEARDPTCVVPGCDETENLEIHHTEPFVESKKTCLKDLCRVCHFHHLLITHRGWRIVGYPGDWEWLPPKPASSSAESDRMRVRPGTPALAGEMGDAASRSLIYGSGSADGRDRMRAGARDP
jgi:hypothetical protein